jgi:hypothetical protein
MNFMLEVPISDHQGMHAKRVGTYHEEAGMHYTRAN